MTGRELSDKRALRRDHIYAAAARLIADRGFKTMTMRELALEAGVSTGMVNHYFANKSMILIGTLRYVSQRMQRRIREAIDRATPGEARLVAFLDSSLPRDEFSVINWKVWTHAFAEANRSPELRELIEERYVGWYQMWREVLADSHLEPEGDALPLIIHADALMNGLVIHHLIVGRPMTVDDIQTSLFNFVKGWHGQPSMADQ